MWRHNLRVAHERNVGNPGYLLERHARLEYGGYDVRELILK